MLFWTVVCLVGVLIRGIRWEEGYERAQVLTGMTPYPDGHPHARWYWNAFSIHYYASAAVLWLTKSAALVCGSRQFMAAIAVHLPIFAITWLLSRRVLAAHFATLLSIVGAITVFQSYMPITPWANKATSGMIGTGWAFWVLAALCAGRWRMAGLLFGLMPLIHIGQWPILMLTVVIWSVWLLLLGQRDVVKHFIRFAAAGLLCCALFAAAQWPFMIPEPTDGAYHGQREGHIVWAEYVTNEDMHRAPVSWPRFGPMGNSTIAMAGFLLLVMPAAWKELRCRAEPPVIAFLFLYAALCIAAIFFAQVVHRMLGANVPYLVVGWMPNRLTIHLAMLVLCGAAAGAFSVRRPDLPWVVLASLAWLALLPAWPWIMDAELVARYFSSPETALFLVAGGALPWLWTAASEEAGFRPWWSGLLFVGLASLAWYHQTAAAAIAGGVSITMSQLYLRKRSYPIEFGNRAYVTTFSLLLLFSLSAALFEEWRTRAYLPVSPFEAEVARYIDQHGSPGDLVLTTLDERYQMVLNQPVVATFETRQHIGYMESLAATVDKLYADVYGVKDGKWYDWALIVGRSEAAWRTLGEAYGIRWVLINDFYPLHLPARLSGEGLVLYEIPPGGTGPPAP